MNVHDIMLTVQYVTISVLFLEILIVFSRWENSIHSYLFLTCLPPFISNLGYLFELQATSEEAYLAALKFSYAGRVWIVFAFFLFAAKMCRVRIPKKITFSLLALHIGIYLSILTIGKNDLYYREYEFIYDPVLPRLYHTNGTMHDLLMALNVIFVAVAMSFVIRGYRKEKNKRSKMKYLMLIVAFGVQAFSFLLQVTGVFGISKYYDLTMPGTLLGTVFMLIAILGFDLLGAQEIAKDFVIDRISEGIIAVDNEGRIQYYNEPVTKIYPEFAAFYGLGPVYAASRNKLHIRTPYDIVSGIGKAVQDGETIQIGERIYTPEENVLQYRGETLGKLYVLTDDTGHYQYMEELAKQRDIADSANEAKSRFLASMSHEIRTPINAVLGMDEMILRESSEQPIKEYAADIMSAGQTLLSLINDILDLSKVEEGRMEIIPVEYDLASLINDLVNMIRDRAAKKGLKFTVNADEHIPHLLFGDEIRLRQCAMNLLTNAVKYTESGEVTLSVGYEKSDDAHIFLSVTVADTGIGMKEEDMEHLFSPYKRLEEKRNRTIEGTGLGMSITRQLLELMGSELKVKSTYGEGSVFSFSVLQKVEKWEKLGNYSARFAQMSGQDYEYHELFHAPDAKILVVDDTEMNLSVIKNLLKRTRIGIDTALSGAEAIRMAEVFPYDLIFIDHMMPDMDGIETLSHIREGGASKDVPAVALTANAVFGAKEMYLRSGFSEYLSKPVDGRKLEQLLYDMLPPEKRIRPEEDAESGSTELQKEAADDTAAASKELLTALEDIPDLDTKAGIKNCGDDKAFLSVLGVFHQTAATKADEIEKLYQNGDIENYTIKVHTLKSSARIIGAGELSAFAKSLEDAGRNQDTAFLEQNTKKLLSMYRELNGRLSCLDTDEEALPAIDEASLKEAYQTICEIAAGMDYGMMEELLKSLKGYRLPDTDQARIRQIEEQLNRLDWDAIVHTAGEAF